MQTHHRHSAQAPVFSGETGRYVPPKATQTQAMPAQKPVSDEPEQKPPSKWKPIVKRIAAILAVIVALSLVYLFLLLGEPSEDSELAKTSVTEETIRVPIAGIQQQGDADLSALASSFGQPLMALSGTDAMLQSATLADTAFEGGYARRVQLVYAFADGSQLTVESLRPTAAVKLLGSNHTLRVDALYTLSGLDAVRMDSTNETIVFASSQTAVYALHCPASHATELSALLKQSVLLQPGIQQ